MIRGLALVVATLALAACGGATLPPAAPSQAPVPAVTPLPAGTYTSLAFPARGDLHRPGRLVLAADSPIYLALQPAGNDTIGVHLFRDPAAASQDPTCPASAEPGVGGTSSALTAWIRERPGLIVTAPTMATVGGCPALRWTSRSRRTGPSPARSPTGSRPCRCSTAPRSTIGW